MAPRVRKADRVGHNNIDRISDLPVNIIECILCHLPIRDVVRTSILSRKWRYMWVSIPQLEFGEDFFYACHMRNIGDQVPGIITGILLLHSGPVSKFTLKIPMNHSMEIPCFYKWILFLSKRGIEDLDLDCYQEEYQKMPSHLFYCQGLKYLKLDFFKLSLPADFRGFKSLLHLQLRDVEFEFGALERLISSCPILDSLTIGHCYGCDCINISSPTLTVLCIEHLEDFESICFKKAKNLTDLTLQIESGAGFIPQLLQDSITSLKYLELDGVDFNKPKMLLFMAALLKSSPNLVELDIRSGGSLGWSVAPLPNHQRAVDCYNSFCLSQLQKVNITVRTANEHALDLTRFLLANSPSLEILTFEVWPWLGRKHYEKLLTISQDLLRLGRASPRAEVKFLYS
ncbi:hypothetical protein RIF29_13550 [Crotalaria pallida]|uniref:F-box domain-containing protein n=1 Tax=Crotalaria pallida TaxID=3830 RepID=A0AAN9P376_CROPI